MSWTDGKLAGAVRLPNGENFVSFTCIMVTAYACAFLGHSLGCAQLWPLWSFLYVVAVLAHVGPLQGAGRRAESSNAPGKEV